MDHPKFDDLQQRIKKRETRREMFSKRVDGVIPQRLLEEHIRLHCPQAGKGRRPCLLVVMLRIHIAQLICKLSDPGMHYLPTRQIGQAVWGPESVGNIARRDHNSQLLLFSRAARPV